MQLPRGASGIKPEPLQLALGGYFRWQEPWLLLGNLGRPQLGTDPRMPTYHHRHGGEEGVWLPLASCLLSLRLLPEGFEAASGGRHQHRRW